MYAKMLAASRMFTSGPASETQISAAGLSERSMRDNPPMGNITISTVRIPKRAATTA